jgi:hypothetical protein
VNDPAAGGGGADEGVAGTPAMSRVNSPGCETEEAAGGGGAGGPDGVRGGSGSRRAGDVSCNART